MERKIQLAMQHRASELSPTTLDEKARSVEMIWTTGQKVLRTGWESNYFEILSLKPEHVRMGRLNSGSAPLLNSHGNYDLSDVLGVVEKAWLSETEGRCVSRFSEREDVLPKWNDVKSGITKNVSVGYKVYRFEKLPSVEGEEIPTYLATDWEPMEISLVPIGADAGATVRSDQGQGAECVVVNNIAERGEKEKTMSEVEKTVGTPAVVTHAPDMEVVKREAIASEKKRSMEIRTAVRLVKLSDEFASKLIDQDIGINEARAMIIDEVAKKDSSVEIRSAHTIEGGKPTQVEARKAGLENALLHRADPSKVTLSDAGRAFRGMSLLESARDFLGASGIGTRGMSKMDLATRAFHSTSDFPEVLANVASKSLRKGYDEAPRTFTGWAKEAQLPDFKQVSRAQLGEAPALEIVKENGEIQRGTIGEGAEKYALATYAKIVGISRKVIINDDLNAFTSIAQKFGFAAASLESDVVYAILTANAALADSVALFHANHKNLGTAGVPSITTIGELVKLMRLQKGLDGKRALNIMGKYLIGPATQELVIMQQMALTTPADQTKVNPYRSLIPVIEPRLDGSSTTAYYLSADPSQCDTVEYGYLEGQQGVYTEIRQGFDVDGMEVKARLDFAAKAIDYRGLAKNVGA